MASRRGSLKRVILVGGVIILAGVLFYHVFSEGNGNRLPEGFTEGNGRIEATEVDIATKLPGRLTAVLVKEGDTVEKDQVVARMDTATLKAQLQQAEAEVERIKQARRTAMYKREETRLRLDLAHRELDRTKRLFSKGSATQQQLDHDLTARQVLDTAYSAAESSIGELDSAITAAVAKTVQIKADIDDCMLKAPIPGPVLTRLAEPGEVLPSGGKVLTIIDPTDIYMNVYLSEHVAGILPAGADAKVVLDAIPDKAFPAKVTYVAEKAQFTPKEVEATEERQKLVFRAKVRLTEYHDPRLKPGMPGVAYIRFDPHAKWPVLIR